MLIQYLKNSITFIIIKNIRRLDESLNSKINKIVTICIKFTLITKP